MTYAHTDLQIIFTCSGSKWHWALEDLQGEVLNTGSAGDYEEAAKSALRAYDWARLGS